MTARWLTVWEPLAVGDVRYLVETLDTSSGRTSWGLRDTPLHTNQSIEPRLHGWCGETNNRSHYARGLVVVSRLAGEQRERVLVRRATPTEARAYLAKAGYPELIGGAS
jgi:hypothetical protein